MPTVISPGAQRLGLRTNPRSPAPGATTAYELVHLFTTQNGAWDPAGRFYDLPDWARSAYLKPMGHPQYFDDAGGDHHLFARVEDEQGNPIAERIRFWSRDGANIDTKNTGDKKSGWANLPVYASFSPERGERGAWLWGPDNATAVADGGGLPNNLHVSSFAVWRRVRLQTEPEQPTDPIVVIPPPTTATEPWYSHLTPAMLLAQIAEAEAGGESMEGQIAVMNVVMNRVRGWRWPNDAMAVIQQPSQFDGLTRITARALDMPADMYMLAALALNGQLADVTGGATHFFGDSYQGDLRQKLAFCKRIGNHDFYRED